MWHPKQSKEVRNYSRNRDIKNDFGLSLSSETEKDEELHQQRYKLTEWNLGNI